MITLITGLTGSGKTFFGTKLLQEQWKLGATIYSNTPLIFSEDNERVEKWTQLAELYGLHNGIIFIDEAQKLFDARRWQSLPMSFAEKIAQHRKHFLDFITTAQDVGHIDLRFRGLVHEIYACQSLLRLPANEREYPIFQVIRVIKKKRVLSDNDRLVWEREGKPRYMFLSRFWTKKIYETYADIGLERYLCKTKYHKKKWVTRIISRELINSGKARL